MKITFPDKSVREYPDGSSALDVAESISHNLALRALAAEVDGRLVDLGQPINHDCELKLLTFDDEQGKQVFWHSTAHMMAQAVKELWPEVKVTIGPSIEEGFYYDFDRDEAFNDADLAAIEAKMADLAKQKLNYERREVSRNEAMDMFEKLGETYKVELLAAIPEGDTITLYSQGNFTDLCRGPHVANTGKLKAFKLLKTAGAYWRGDEKNKMLKRIYGISFPAAKDLDKYLADLEEKKKRDHRKIGRDLDLFSISDDIGAGLVLWHPNGAMVRYLIENYWREQHLEAGYKLVFTPHLGKGDLWRTSGHLDFYADGMYPPMMQDEQDYFVKPMNCPFHIAIYKSNKRSYKELPLRYAELGTVYRNERSGQLHGLMRVRGFTQDDAHIICTPEQLEGEVDRILEFSLGMLLRFGFEEFGINLSTRPEKYVGDLELWDKAEASLKGSLDRSGLKYAIKPGDGAFYGPKIDIDIKDALNRSWQCTTVQFDFNEPERFNMEYIGTDNKPHRPYMIHRALLGSIERFFGTLIEYYAGNFPFWLAPIQVMVIPVSDNFQHYAERVLAKLRKNKIRADIDLRSEKIGYKIRDAEMKKIPYMFVVGEKEEDTKSVSIRRHVTGDLGRVEIDEAVVQVLAEKEK